MNKKCANRRKGSFRKNQDYDKKSKSPKDVESNVDSNKGFNDFSWYNKNPLLTDAVARIPFPYRPGMDFPTRNGTWKIPGVIRLRCALSVGQSGVINTNAAYSNDSFTSPIGLAAKEIYAKVRSAFSGTLVCDAPDILMYLMAIDSINVCIARFKRIFRTITMFNYYNYVVPETLLFAMTGQNSAVVSQFQAQKMEMYNYINQLVGMVRKFYMPALMPLFNRHYWLADNIFGDSDSPMSQLYLIDPDVTYTFGLINDAGGLIPDSFKYDAANVSTKGNWGQQYFNYIKDKIKVLAESEDAYTISGYLQRAYADSPQFLVEPILYDEQLTIAYDELVLSQIENAKVYPVTIETLTVKQNPSNGGIISAPTFTTTDLTTDFGDMQPINIRSLNPSVEQVVEATRFMAGIASSSTTPGTYYVKCGSEVCYDMSVIKGTLSVSIPFDAILGDQPIQGDEYNLLWALLEMEAFDWHPIVTLLLKSSKAGEKDYPMLVGDAHNLTNIDLFMMNELNKVALYSMFDAFSLNN